MEESSQMSVVEGESQQTLAESQMSDQDFQESQSQMETSQQLIEDSSQPEKDATIPKIDQENNAPPSTTGQAMGHATGQEVTGQEEVQSQMETSQQLLGDSSQPKIGQGNNAPPSTTVQAMKPATDPEVTGQVATGQETMGQEATGQEATGQEATGQEATGQEATGQEATGQEATGQEATGQEATGQEATGPEATGQEATGQVATGQVATGQEATGQETTGQETTGQEATGQEATGQEATGQEATGQEATGQEATGQEATGQETTGQEATGQEATGQNATGQEATGQEATEPDKNLSRNGHQSEKVHKSDEKMVPEKSEEFMDVEAPFPDTLEGFKYAFNKHGQLRHTETGKPFEFEVKWGDRYYNQQHYEALGEVITQHVYQLLETETKLKRVYLGENEDEPRTFIFMSENALTTTDKLLILIHGSGVVRAGQWARRLIINECLYSGTQIPYIERAMQEGYEVLVMNTNDNYATLSNGRRVSIKGSSGPSEHGLAVWDRFVAETPAEHVAIVAHSYGGVVTVDLALRRAESFRRKVFAVAFTDSVHSLPYDMYDDTHEWFINNAINWVTSHKNLGIVIDDRGYDCPRISAGTMKHEETSCSSFPAIFEFFKNKEEKRKNPTTVNEPTMEDTEQAAGDGTPGAERTEQAETQAQGTGEAGKETEL